MLGVGYKLYYKHQHSFLDITLTNNERRVVGRPVVTIPSSPSPFCLPPVDIHKRLSKPKRVRRKGAGSVSSQSAGLLEREGHVAKGGDAEGVPVVGWGVFQWCL